MTLLLMTLLLAIAFAILTGLTIETLIVGSVVAVLVIAVTPMLPAPRSLGLPDIASGRKVPRLLWNLCRFTYDFFKDLTISNFYIAYDVLTPRNRYSPELIRIPVDDLTDLQLYILATRISLTPGTLSVDVTGDRRWLIVHVMYPQGDATAANLRRPITILSEGLQS